jgi:3-methyladenine DNA glycosylase Tag
MAVSFAPTLKLAETHSGGAAALARRLAEHPPLKGGLDRGDDRFLSGMTQAVFSAGFNWQVIETKWSGFETAFEQFNPRRVAAYGDDDLDRLLKDVHIVRNGPKIRSTIENARFVVDTVREHGSFGAFLKAWPTTDQVGLMDHLKKRGSRLGGATGQYFLRFNGWDAFILSPDVVRALQREGVVDGQPTSKRDLAAVQAAFNAWVAQTGRPQCEVSRVLAYSVGPT